MTGQKGPWIPINHTQNTQINDRKNIVALQTQKHTHTY